ncbi:MAG: hypothetical protein OXE53_23285 [Deltaproteobacteria bacterium]|nr:hypothetical protein [Deltaproteobacteria bacterium]
MPASLRRPLRGGRARILLLLALLLGALLVLHAAPAQAQAAVTVTLSATSTTVTEGETATLTVTLSAAPTTNFIIPLTVSATSGVTGGSAGVTILANTVSETVDIPTSDDADADDETFFVHIDTANLAAGYVVGAAETTYVEFTIADDDKLALTIRDGTGELQIGPYAGLSNPEFVHWVQVSPATARVTLTPTWQAGSVWATSGFSASVRYITHGRDGSAITWSSSENGTGKQLELLTPGLGSPGHPRLTLTAGSIEYVIQFQSNFSWETHNNTLLAVLEMRTSPQ